MRSGLEASSRTPWTLTSASSAYAFSWGELSPERMDSKYARAGLGAMRPDTTVRLHGRVDTASGGRTGRARAPRRVAPAPAAALARRAARERLGAGRGRRDRARRHRLPRGRVDRPPRARARPGGAEDRARPAARLHARPCRPLRA